MKSNYKFRIFSPSINNAKKYKAQAQANKPQAARSMEIKRQESKVSLLKYPTFTSSHPADGRKRTPVKLANQMIGNGAFLPNSYSEGQTPFKSPPLTVSDQKAKTEKKAPRIIKKPIPEPLNKENPVVSNFSPQKIVVNKKSNLNISSREVFSAVGVVSIPGRSEGRMKTNQDSVVVDTNLQGDSGSSLVGVFDGHGLQGHRVSSILASTAAGRPG